MKNEPDRCGYGLFSTDEHDPYYEQCQAHDRAYVYKSRSKKEADRLFIAAIRKEARESGRLGLKVRAEIYAVLARVGGLFVW